MANSNKTFTFKWESNVYGWNDNSSKTYWYGENHRMIAISELALAESLFKSGISFSKMMTIFQSMGMNVHDYQLHCLMLDNGWVFEYNDGKVVSGEKKYQAVEVKSFTKEQCLALISLGIIDNYRKLFDDSKYAILLCENSKLKKLNEYLELFNIEVITLDC